jgi:tRNA threonylcarbamoyladenosine biosynthesis protein TsaB
MRKGCFVERIAVNQMITLALDTCDRNGSVAVRMEGNVAASRLHGEEEYSSWLIPAVESSLAEVQKALGEVDLLAVATGPGSFTGVRVGLCAMKAWAEVYGKRVVGVSRLESMAKRATADGMVATFFDAHRGQVFGGLYRRAKGIIRLIDQELVIAPQQFLAFVSERTGAEAVQWICLEPELITGLSGWESEAAKGSELHAIEGGVASLIGELAEEKAARGEFTDVLQLDANYVRRSDAEIYWKGPAHRVG